MANVKRSCDKCARKDSQFCGNCIDEDFFITEKDKIALDVMCELMCGSVEEEVDDDEDCTEEWDRYYYDTRL